MTRRRWLLILVACALALGATGWLLSKVPPGGLTPRALLSAAKQSLPVHGYARFARAGAPQPFLYARLDGKQLRLAPTAAGLEKAKPVTVQTVTPVYEKRDPATHVIILEQRGFDKIALPIVSPQVVGAYAKPGLVRDSRPDRLLPEDEFHLLVTLMQRDRAGALWVYTYAAGGGLARAPDGGPAWQIPLVIDPSHVWLALTVRDENGTLQMEAFPRYDQSIGEYFVVLDGKGQMARVTYEVRDAAGTLLYQGGGHSPFLQLCSVRTPGPGRYQVTATLHGPAVSHPIRATCTVTTPLKRATRTRRPY